MRFSLGNLCKINISIFNPIWTKYFHHNILNSTLEYDSENIFAQIELNIEISILQRFLKKKLHIEFFIGFIFCHLKGHFSMKDVFMHVFSIFMQKNF